MVRSLYPLSAANTAVTRPWTFMGIATYELVPKKSRNGSDANSLSRPSASTGNSLETALTTALRCQSKGILKVFALSVRSLDSICSYV